MTFAKLFEFYKRELAYKKTLIKKINSILFFKDETEEKERRGVKGEVSLVSIEGLGLG